ncbi:MULTISPECIES: hypothetical protein [unclassified Exiguobacterium]|uniref:hypothetical protein n=1 Tax=unclassified Exiguobacterium TaxID=2644629 RepID=UPI001BECE017|nr:MULTISPECIES: hypothetical protein [unclassified Exiguobacterium]
MRHYSDLEFVEIVHDKIGNVRFFKQHLRKRGLIGNRQQFSDEHVRMFKNVKEFKLANHTTWAVAFEQGLNSILQEEIQVVSNITMNEQAHQSTEQLLTEILNVLQRIEAKL